MTEAERLRHQGKTYLKLAAFSSNARAARLWRNLAAEYLARSQRVEQHETAGVQSSAGREPTEHKERNTKDGD
jgi:hypothetical protein